MSGLTALYHMRAVCHIRRAARFWFFGGDGWKEEALRKKAILYARVSTDDQADRGYSLPSQLEAMRRYAAAQSFDVAAEICDDYSGATPIEFRPEGRKAHAMLQAGAADVLVAYSMDRIVRPPEDGDEWDMPILIRGLAKLGKEIHTVSRGKLNTNFADLLIALLDARKAGEERRDIRERSIRGKRAKAKAGRVIGVRAPYGYRHLRDEHGKAITLIADETTGRIVKLIFTWYVKGDEKGRPLTARAIALRLTNMRVPTPDTLQRGYGFRKRTPGVWGVNSIIKILDRETYAGTWHYGLFERKAGRKSYNQGDGRNAIAVTVPAIIERRLWEQAQARRRRNIQMAMRNCKRNYLLRGMIRCGECDTAMTGRYVPNKTPVTYYDCGQHRNLFPEEQRCQSRMVRTDAIEADVWDSIEELFADPDRFADKLKQAQQNEEDAQRPIREKLQITEDFIQQAHGDADKIARALRNAEEGGAVYDSLKRDEKEVNGRLIELAKKREDLVSELEARQSVDDSIETIGQFAEDVRTGMDNPDFDCKRRILERLRVKVTVVAGRYHIECVVGETEGPIRDVTKPPAVFQTNWH